MQRQQIFDLMKQNPVFHLATVENGEPRVRGMLLYRADHSGILFHTGATKEVCRQLLDNPAVELCFNDMHTFVQVRVQGKAQLVDDAALKEEIVNAPGREFLKPWVEAQGLEILSVFRIDECVAQAWSMATNFAPKEYIPLTA